MGDCFVLAERGEIKSPAFLEQGFFPSQGLKIFSLGSKSFVLFAVFFGGWLFQATLSFFEDHCENLI